MCFYILKAATQKCFSKVQTCSHAHKASFCPCCLHPTCPMHLHGLFIATSSFCNIHAFLSVTPPGPASSLQTKLKSLFPDTSPLACCMTLFKSELDGPVNSIFEKKNAVAFWLFWAPSINFQRHCEMSVCFLLGLLISRVTHCLSLCQAALSLPPHHLPMHNDQLGANPLYV